MRITSASLQRQIHHRNLSQNKEVIPPASHPQNPTAPRRQASRAATISVASWKPPFFDPTPVSDVKQQLFLP